MKLNNKSKEIFDYSRNIINFTKKKVLHDCNIKKNFILSDDFVLPKKLKQENFGGGTPPPYKLSPPMSYISPSKDNKDLNNNLYMKVDNILNRFQYERINNFLKFTNHLDKYSKSVNFFKEDNTFQTSLSKIKHNYNKTFGGLPPPKTLVSTVQFARGSPLMGKRESVLPQLKLGGLCSPRSSLINEYPKLILPPRPPPLPPRIKKKINIDIEINNISDLLKLCKDYPLKFDVEYNIDMETIHRIKKPLNELNSMIGMKKLKTAIVDQILFFIQNLHYNKNTKESDFMHTVIYGPPGTGKTEIAKIMGKIFSKLNVLSSGKFTKVTRAELIAGYLGQTAIKTKEAMKKSLGGVLFIDEAYALGNSEKRDSFAKTY